VVIGFGFRRRDVTDRREQAAVVEPVDPFEGRVLDGFQRPPRPAPMDHLGFVEPVDRLGERVVVTVADAADRWHETGLGEPLGVLDRHVLHAAVGVVDEAAAREGPTIVQGLLQCVEHEARVRRPADAPADDAPGVGVDHEGHVDEPGPGGHVGEVRHPQHVRPRRPELPIDAIERADGCLVSDRCAHPLAADHPLQTHFLHQPGDRASGHLEALPLHLPPDLAHAIDLEVVIENPADLAHQLSIPLDPCRCRLRVLAAARMGVIGRRGDRQYAADRLDPVLIAVRIDEADHGFHRRSSSAWAK